MGRPVVSAFRSFPRVDHSSQRLALEHACLVEKSLRARPFLRCDRFRARAPVNSSERPGMAGNVRTFSTIRDPNGEAASAWFLTAVITSACDEHPSLVTEQEIKRIKLTCYNDRRRCRTLRTRAARVHALCKAVHHRACSLRISNACRVSVRLSWPAEAQAHAPEVPRWVRRSRCRIACCGHRSRIVPSSTKPFVALLTSVRLWSLRRTRASL